MKQTTIADLAKSAKIDVDQFTEVVKENFQNRTPVEITKDTQIKDLSESLQGQVGLTAWAFTQ